MLHGGQSSDLRRNLYGWFGVASQEILEEIFVEMLLRKKYCGFAVYLQIKSLTKIFDQNAQQYVALQEGFLGDRIGDARIFGAVRAENKSKNLFFAESREK